MTQYGGLYRPLVVSNPLEPMLELKDKMNHQMYCILEPQVQCKGFFKAHTLPSYSIIAISKNVKRLLSSKDALSKDIPLFSPSFRCHTALFFYGALLMELKKFVKKIDHRSSTNREVVWMQLCSLVGMEKDTSELFSPVLASTLNQKKMNILEIEIFYLTFLLVLIEFPTILDKDLNGLEEKTGLKYRCEKNAADFFSVYFGSETDSIYPGQHIIPHVNHCSSFDSHFENFKFKMGPFLTLSEKIKTLHYWSHLLQSYPPETLLSNGHFEFTSPSFLETINLWATDVDFYCSEINSCYEMMSNFNFSLGQTIPSPLCNNLLDMVQTSISSPLQYNQPSPIFINHSTPQLNNGMFHPNTQPIKPEFVIPKIESKPSSEQENLFISSASSAFKNPEKKRKSTEQLSMDNKKIKQQDSKVGGIRIDEIIS